ncbi:MAG: hypothetical protein Q4F18_13525, partial [Clostridia bacterium]|nr:hypothetical protein [Clostridia bacterium]
ICSDFRKWRRPLAAARKTGQRAQKHFGVWSASEEGARTARFFVSCDSQFKPVSNFVDGIAIAALGSAAMLALKDFTYEEHRAADTENETVAQALLFVFRRFACLLPPMAADSGSKPAWGFYSQPLLRFALMARFFLKMA